VLEHIRNGVHILQQHQDDILYSKSDKMIPLQKLIPAFARLERQFHELTGSPTPFIQALASEQTAAGFFQYKGPDPQPVPSFSSLNHAWINLHQRWHGLISCAGIFHRDWFNHMGDVQHKDDQVPKSSLEQYIAEMRRDFDLWSLGLNSLRKRLHVSTPRDASIHGLLQCYALLADTILGTMSSPRGTLFDEYRDHYEQIVQLCHTVIEYEMLESGAAMIAHSKSIAVRHRYSPDNEQGATASSRHARCPLTFDMGLCMILYHVISKCRDARIRLNAIKLFEDYPRLEGLWDGAIIAKIGRAVDSVERQGANLEEAAARGASAAEIPLSQRVLEIRGKPDIHSRSAELILLKVKGESGLDTVPILTSFVW
jgi:hypothetical protein